MSAQPQPRLTPEEYLKIERASELKHDYYNGQMYVMSGGSHRHAIIIPNLGAELRFALKGRPCTVATSELRVRIGPGGLYSYPDVVVACGESRYLDHERDTLLNPTLVIEVLSPSTEAYDRGFKAAQYRTLESLQEYALVAQSEPRVEVYRRQTSGWLLSEFAGLEAVSLFESVGCTVALREIYDKVTFGAGDPLPNEGAAS